MSNCPESASYQHSPPNTNGNCTWCGAHIHKRPRPMRWANYGEAIEALGRADGASPDIDDDPDEDDGRQMWWPGYVHTD